MPITKNGLITTFTASDDEVKRMTDLERQAREGNFIVEQHTASINESKEQGPDKSTGGGILKIHRLMKLISSGARDSMLVLQPMTPAPEIQTHTAASTMKDTNTNNNDTNIKLLGLMKKITNGPGF